MHDFRPATEGWLDWHLRTWRRASEHLTATWDCRPAVIMEACAVSSARRLADKPACSVVGGVKRARPAADMAATRQISGGALRQRIRRRLGRFCPRWEEVG